MTTTTSTTSTAARQSPATPGPAAAGRGGGRIGPRARVRHVLALARRNALQIRQDPESMTDAVVTPLLFTLLFVFVFGGALTDGDRGAYVNWLVPGLLSMMCMIIAMAVGTGVNEDFKKGVMDRFRTLPIAGSSVLLAKVLIELVRLLVATAITLAVGVALGLEIGGRWLETLAAVGLTTLFAVSLVWIFILLGLALRTAQAVQGIGFTVMMPLQFCSSIFVPTDSMPGWLQGFAEHQPLSHLAEASRNLINGTGDAGGPALAVVAWSVGITLVTAPLAVSRFRAKTA